jgi:SAM-dependent methyltransferase
MKAIAHRVLMGASTRAVLVGLLAAATPVWLRAQQVAPPARAPDVHFVPTDTAVVRAMLEAARVGRKDLVYDLGCGDGRIVITAIKRHGARGVCIDIDPARIAESHHNADTAGVTGRIEIRRADLFETDLRSATVVTLYLLPQLNERLRPKLFRELRPGARVVSHAFDMGEWKADRVLTIPTVGGFSSYAYYWVMPADVAGTWKVRLPEGEAAGENHDYEVSFEQRFQVVPGARARSRGRTAPVTDAYLVGDSLSFTVSDTLSSGVKQLHFSGKVQSDRISGQVRDGEADAGSWSAVRIKRGPRPELELTAAAGLRPGS